MNIKFDYKNALNFMREDELALISPAVSAAHSTLHNGTAAGSDFTGWLNLPEDYDKDEFEEVIKAAEKIRSDSDVLIVIGIGGSYLGARAAIEMLKGALYNNLDDGQRGGPQIYFAGNGISSTYLAQLVDIIRNKEVSLNVISKSGTTTEPAIAFRVLLEIMNEKYGANASSRIYATTDKARGALFTMAKQAGYKTFVIPDNVGGRYSVLTPVGLLPIAVSGADIKMFMQGAKDAMAAYSNPNLDENDCYQYAAVRNILYRKGYTTEMLINYETQLHYFGEWWKQLYGESEGKDHKGIFPAAADFSTDLHSMGQYIQDGRRNLFETVITVKKPNAEITIPENKENLDGLNYIAGKTIDYVNTQAFLGTVMAHNDGGVPNLVIEIEKMDEYTLGNLVYFFEKACGISGYILGVNPFDQPGVEAYKKNMFALLGKPGFEDMHDLLAKRLKN
ncbi:MAG: glucose-6-phosphate isomerase [Clostridia bacterium]|nr:glucose-6-phosphate isomerase [Clostridia bacterium]